MPQLQFKPGIADEVLRELAPLLAEEGIDLDNIDVPDLGSLQRALDCAVERRNTNYSVPSARPATSQQSRCGSLSRPSSTVTLACALPAGRWNRERAAADILVLAGKGRAFRCPDKPLTRQGRQIR